MTEWLLSVALKLSRKIKAHPRDILVDRRDQLRTNRNTLRLHRHGEKERKN